MRDDKTDLNGRESTGDLLFTIALDISVAQETLEDRGQPITLETIKRELLGGRVDASVTDERIRQGLAQVVRWEEQRKLQMPSILKLRRRPPWARSSRKIG